jgi:UvrD-like helicase C-terminal domain/AAA domain
VSVLGFHGAAGTGKTTKLMAALELHLATSPLAGESKVLALTRMHGSRHRLIDRLGQTSCRDRYECMTFDRFAWELNSRWRSLLRDLGHAPTSEFDYDATCEAAARLLAIPHVVKWVAARYPIALVDEFQDCRGGRLDMVKSLVGQAELFVAADEFQDLQGTGQSEAVTWLRTATDVEELSTFHRTSDLDLLAMGAALRSGSTVSKGKNAKVFSAPTPNVAAGFLARGIAWSGRDDTVVLSATTSANPFVRDTLVRLAAKPIGPDGKQLGPYNVGWEQSRDNLEGQLCTELGLPDDAEATISGPHFPSGSTLPAHREIARWIESQRNLRGDVPFLCRELRARVRRSVQHLRAQPGRMRGIRCMTIHQAKNREFDRVLVLWPMGVPGDIEVQRRLLYNAVTRAKKSATIIVQDPKRSRTTSAPFVWP